MTCNIKFYFHSIAFALLFLNCFTDSSGAVQPDSLFRSDEVINIELRSDFTAIQNDRIADAVYHDGELIYYNPGGEAVKIPVRLMIRGKFRRDTANCNFPPLYVNFKKKEVKNTLFDNQDKLKLVTPCQYDKYVINEYLIYKMYNQVTDLSFKVRLVKVLYYDNARNKKLFERYSFFLEEKKHVAERNNTFEKDIVASPFDINKDNFKKMAFFQYMIGNIDWFFKLKQNVLILQPNDTTQAPLAVPFDFDLSAFVNADYALPKKGSDREPAKRRVYKGLCYTAEELEEAFKFYRDKRPLFEAIINNSELISKSSKKQMIKYIDYFYTVIENKKLIKQEFLDECETSFDYKVSF